jgi:iron-sulfur cluster insertion protein
MELKENIITITEPASEKILDIIVAENNPNLKLRIFVQGGGCSGFQYGFTLDEEQAEDDSLIEMFGVGVLVDAMSYQYLIGATIDYKEDEMSNQFVIQNPNAQSSCGCGSSFSV